MVSSFCSRFCLVLMVILATVQSSSAQKDDAAKLAKLRQQIELSIAVAKNELGPLQAKRNQRAAKLLKLVKGPSSIIFALSRPTSEKKLKRIKKMERIAKDDLEGWTWFLKTIDSPDELERKQARVKAMEYVEAKLKKVPENLQTYLNLQGALKRGSEATDENWDLAANELEDAKLRLSIAQQTLEGLTGDESLKQEVIERQRVLIKEAQAESGDISGDHQKADTPLRLKYKSLKRQLEETISSTYVAESVTIDNKTYATDNLVFHLDKADYVREFRNADETVVIRIQLRFIPKPDSKRTGKLHKDAYPIYDFRGNHRSIDVNGIQVVVKRYRPDEGGPDLYAFLDEAVDLEALARIGIKKQPNEEND